MKDKDLLAELQYLRKMVNYLREEKERMVEEAVRTEIERICADFNKKKARMEEEFKKKIEEIEPDLIYRYKTLEDQLSQDFNKTKEEFEASVQGEVARRMAESHSAAVKKIAGCRAIEI